MPSHAMMGLDHLFTQAFGGIHPKDIAYYHSCSYLSDDVLERQLLLSQVEMGNVADTLE